MNLNDFIKNAPDTPTPVEEKAIIERLTDRQKKMKELLHQNRMNIGALRMWISFLRAQMTKIYGKNSDIIKYFPPIREKLTPAEAVQIAYTIYARVESYLGFLNEGAPLAFGPRTAGKVFIGHGQSSLWRELKDFLSDRLGLAWDEFNREAVAGFTTFERLSQMLAEAKFAFLIMTAEDEHIDQALHARENVVHEVGLFQGSLGPKRAIILLEEGCAEFSNIIGLSQIRFPRGRISAAFEEIRRVLEREGIIE